MGTIGHGDYAKIHVTWNGYICNWKELTLENFSTSMPVRNGGDLVLDVWMTDVSFCKEISCFETTTVHDTECVQTYLRMPRKENVIYIFIFKFIKI
jgi:hypothetical protein